MILFLTFLIIISGVIGQFSTNSSMGDCRLAGIQEADVFQYLKVKNPNYTEDSRPVKYPTDPILIWISIGLYGIEEFVSNRSYRRYRFRWPLPLQLESDGSVVFEGFIDASWQDEVLIWNETFPYNCIDAIIVRSAFPIWRPDLIINTNEYIIEHWTRSSKCLQNCDCSNTDFQNQLLTAAVKLWSNGEALFLPQGRFSSNCELDLTYFPFDQQVVFCG